jgi:(S)-ureidoglycine aminohydrolase
MDSRLLMPSRGCVAPNYFLMTPDNFVANALPHFTKTVIRLLTTPRDTAARFGQYLLEVEPDGGSLQPQGKGFENFLFQLTGQATLEEQGRAHTLRPGDYCYLPLGTEFLIRAPASDGARVLWTKRRYEPVEGVALPAAVFGNQSQTADIVPPPPGAYTYRELLPASDPSYDFAMNVLTAQPGGSIGLIEIHHQEHGLLMLTGKGIYYLAGDFHEVKAGDYIYMAPYCPQSFYGIGDEPASYLLYKDVNRDGF